MPERAWQGASGLVTWPESRLGGPPFHEADRSAPGGRAVWRRLAGRLYPRRHARDPQSGARVQAVSRRRESDPAGRRFDRDLLRAVPQTVAQPRPPGGGRSHLRRLGRGHQRRHAGQGTGARSAAGAAPGPVAEERRRHQPVGARRPVRPGDQGGDGAAVRPFPDPPVRQAGGRPGDAGQAAPVHPGAMVHAALFGRALRELDAGRLRCDGGEGREERDPAAAGSSARPVRDPHGLSRAPSSHPAARPAIGRRDRASPHRLLHMQARPLRRDDKRIHPRRCAIAGILSARHRLLPRRLSAGDDRGDGPPARRAPARLADPAAFHRATSLRLPIRASAAISSTAAW